MLTLDPVMQAIISAICAIFVCWLIIGKHSPLNTWRMISNRFRAKTTLDHYDFYRASIVLGWITYRGIVRIAILKEGLYLAITPIFRMGMHNILIPWQELTLCTGQPKSFNIMRPLQIMLCPGAKLTIGHPVITTLWISKKIFERIDSYIINRQ